MLFFYNLGTFDTCLQMFTDMQTFNKHHEHSINIYFQKFTQGSWWLFNILSIRSFPNMYQMSIKCLHNVPSKLLHAIPLQYVKVMNITWFHYRIWILPGFIICSNNDFANILYSTLKMFSFQERGISVRTIALKTDFSKYPWQYNWCPHLEPAQDTIYTRLAIFPL